MSRGNWSRIRREPKISEQPIFILQLSNLSQSLVPILRTRLQLRTTMSNRSLQPFNMFFGRINLPTQLQQPVLFLLRLSRGRRESSPDLRQQIFRKPQTSMQCNDRSRVQL